MLNVVVGAGPGPSGEAAPPTPRVPMGLAMVGMVASFITGAATARQLHEIHAGLAWVTSAALCAALFVLARWVAGRYTPLRFVALAGLFFLTLASMLVVGAESLPRPGRGAWGFITAIASGTVFLGAMASLPALLVLAGFRREPSGVDAEWRVQGGRPADGHWHHRRCRFSRRADRVLPRCGSR